MTEEESLRLGKDNAVMIIDKSIYLKRYFCVLPRGLIHSIYGHVVVSQNARGAFSLTLDTDVHWGSSPFWPIAHQCLDAIKATTLPPFQRSLSHRCVFFLQHQSFCSAEFTAWAIKRRYWLANASYWYVFSLLLYYLIVLWSVCPQMPRVIELFQKDMSFTYVLLYL